METAVKSAAAAGQTFLSGHIPEGCSVGTKSGCIIFEARADCIGIPMKEKSAFSDIASLFPSMEYLDRFLQQIPPFSVLPALGFGLVLLSSSLSIISGLTAISFPFKTIIRFTLSMLGFISYLAFAGIVIVVYAGGITLAELADGTLRKGSVYALSINAAALGLIHLGVVIAEIVAGHS